MRLSLAAMLVCALVMPAGAQKPVPVKNPLTGLKGLRCSFTSYGAARWNGTVPEILTGTQDFSFQVDSLDYRRGRARIVADGSTLATMLLTETGMNIIEQTPIGNLNLTTIFVAGGEGQKYLSVHSRHLGDLTGVPRSSQNYGTCEAVR